MTWDFGKSFVTSLQTLVVKSVRVEMVELSVRMSVQGSRNVTGLRQELCDKSSDRGSEERQTISQDVGTARLAARRLFVSVAWHR